jgi:hypothetical protein
MGVFFIEAEPIMNTYSLNEIEAMGKCASKGAGMHWGHAEEAGKAVRWLAQRGLPGPELLSACLSEFDRVSYDDLTPSLNEATWQNNSSQAVSRQQCPLITGPILCDYAEEFKAHSIVDFKSVSHPLLLTPYMAIVAKTTEQTLKLSWSGVKITLSDTQCHIDGLPVYLFTQRADLVTCQQGSVQKNTPNSLNHSQTGRSFPPETWTQLTTFSYRTYAPATEASRLSGAGAGVRDND